MAVRNKIACVILAGGKGSRLDGAGKLNQKIGKYTMLDIVYKKIETQFDIIAINVKSKNTFTSKIYQNITYDYFDEDIGPLAGIHSAMKFTNSKLGKNSLLITVPVDTPFLPGDLYKKLMLEYKKSKSQIVVAKSNGKRHPTIALWQSNLVNTLEKKISENVRKIDHFSSYYSTTFVEWNNKEIDPFFNINDYNDLKYAESMLKIK